MNRLQAISYRNADEVEDQIELTGEVSEWLFNIGFWAEVNKENGTIFDLYETDEAGVGVLSSMSELLSKYIDKLNNSNNDSFRFIYRYDHEKNPMYLTVNKKQTLFELKRFKEFLAANILKNKPLYLSL